MTPDVFLTLGAEASWLEADCYSGSQGTAMFVSRQGIRGLAVAIAILTSVGARGWSAAAQGPGQASDPKAAPKDGRVVSVRGTVIDRSAGVLPGVTVVVVATDG